MFDILKKRKSRKTVGSYSKVTKKEKPNSLLCSLFRMFKKKKNKNLVNETLDDNFRRKADEDRALLNGLEWFNPGMRCSLTSDCDNLQVIENPCLMGDIVGDIKKKQHKQSCADNGRVKELEDWERTMILTNQDNLQKHVHIIIDSGTCKIAVYSDATSETEGDVRRKNTEKYSNMKECNNLKSDAFDVEKNLKDMQMTLNLNICRSETGQDENEQCNQKPTAIVLPTRHQTSTNLEASSTTSVVLSEFVEGNTNELDESSMVDTDGDTQVKTDESDDVHTVNSSSNMEPQNTNSFEKDIDQSSSILSCSFENNSTDVPSLQERDNRFFKEINISSIVSVSLAGQEMVQETAGQETVQETENVRNFTRNDTYSEDQKSRNENIKDAVTGIQMFDQTDVQHQDIQDSHLVHSDYTLYPPKSHHSPHSVKVGNSQEGNNASCHTQMFTKLDHEMKCSSTSDFPSSCITDMTATKLVQKVNHLESEIRKLSKLMFTMMSILRFPGSMKKQYAVIPKFQENCKSYLNDDDIISLIKGSSLQVASLLDNSFIHPECWEHNGHSSSACVCLASIASDLESLQYSGLKQLSQTTNLCIMAEEKNGTCSYSNNKGETVNKDTMLKVQKDSKRGEPANQPTAMLTVDSPVWEIRGESDEIGHTLSLQTNLGEDNFDHNMDIKESMEVQAEQSSLLVVMDIDAKKHGCGSFHLKYSEDKEQNHNENKSRCFSEAVKTDTMLKVQKDSKRGEPANQPTAMLTVDSPVWDTRAESDEIGHTLSLQTNSLDHNIKESMEDQAEQSSFVVETNKIKSSKSKENCSSSEKIIIVGIDDAKKHGCGLIQFKKSEEKEQNHNEDKSECLSEISLHQSIIIGRTNKTPMEDTENDAQLETTSNSTTPKCAKATDSRGYSVKDNTDSGEIPMMDDKPAFINSDADVSCLRESVKDQVNLNTDETAVRTSKLNLEASDSCSNVDSIHKSCLDQKENVVGLSACDLKVKETACCFNTYATHASDASSLHIDSSVNVSPINTDHCVHFPDMDPVISDPEHIPGHGTPAQHEEYQQKQSLFGYSCDHFFQVQDKSKEEFTRESNFIWDSDPEQPRANKFETMCKVQKEELKETSSVLKKSQRRSKLGVNFSCRHCSLQRKRRGKKRKVKLRKNMELGRKVSHTENFPRMLSELKILLHYLTSSFAQDTVQSGNLTQATKMIKGKTDFATELGIVVSAKNNSSQESLIDDFLKSLVSPWFIFPTISSGLQRVILLPTGLQLYFERLLRGAPPEERERMSYEWLRLQTFINYPLSAPGSGIRLARAGFYYSGNGTVTVCYACGGQHSGWNFHDDPFEIHRRISPDCPFLRGNPTCPNIPIMQEGELIGIQMGSNTSNTPLSQTMVNSPSSSNRTSDMSLPAAFQSQSSSITQAHSSVAVLPSINNSQEGGSEQQASQQTMSKDEHSLGTAEDITQPADDAENTQYKSPEVFGLVEPSGQVEDPGVDPTPQTMSEQPRHPEYAPLSSRVNSYTGWPARLDQTPQQMAEAGFYYAGINDYTHCFQCGGGLRNWEPGDNPWIEHARWYPQCAYVLGKRGQRFVNAVLKKQTELVAAQRNNSNTTTTSVTTTTSGTITTAVTTTTIVTTMTSGTSTTSGTTTTNGTTITNGTTMTSMSSGAISKTCNAPVLEPAIQTGQLRCFQNSNENEIANRLINEMGYQRERVREAILEVKRRRGKQEIAVEHVIELLIADEERRARVSPASSTFSNQEELQSNNSAADNRLPSQPLHEATPPLAFNSASLREEYLQLRDQNLCKICMERNVELAFIPCGHLVCCEICGQTLRFCPICRAKIHASLKTYRS